MPSFGRSRSTVLHTTGGHPSRGVRPMESNLAKKLDAKFDSFTVVRQLHDVPPHEVYEVTVNGQHAIYKGNTGPTGTARKEGRVMACLGERTSIPVPETVLVADEFYVAKWHDDAPSPKTEYHADEEWARAAGRGLARLHDETAPVIDSYGSFRPDGSLKTCGYDEWNAAAIEYVRDRRPVLARYGHADMADRVIEYLEAHPEAFAGAGRPVCCHGWATPEHVSVGDGDVACMIDFEHAIAAPGEYDYWRTVFPAFGTKENTAHNAFRESYESVRSLPDEFERRRPIYGLLNSVYYFESLYVQNQHGPEETAEQAERLRSRLIELLDTPHFS